MRWNTKAERIDKELPNAVLKTISAFLNTDGGTLLIGVKDDGEIYGVGKDGFQNDDKYLTHLTELITNRIGKNFTVFVDSEIVVCKDKKVVIVKCNKSSQPAYLKLGKGDNAREEFCIRTGSASHPLDTSKIFNYVSEHFPKI